MNSMKFPRLLSSNFHCVALFLSDRENILYADIDFSACAEPKQIHGVVGYYNRFDIFKLTVDRSANRPIAFEMESSGQATESTPGVS